MGVVHEHQRTTRQSHSVRLRKIPSPPCIARSALPPDLELAVNSLIEFTSPDGQTSFAGFLRELSGQRALVDFNHPLAGKAIRFEVEIIAIM